MSEILCTENIFRRELVEQVIKMFDRDGSDSIQFEELISELLKHLEKEIEPAVEWADVKKHIQERFDIKIEDANTEFDGEAN